MLHVEIDRRLCSGTSNCIEDAPLAYELGPDGLARVRTGATDEDLLIGARTCPMDAIRVIDPLTGKRLHPS